MLIPTGSIDPLQLLFVIAALITILGPALSLIFFIGKLVKNLYVRCVSFITARYSLSIIVTVEERRNPML
jgi:hypothetical protein